MSVDGLRLGLITGRQGVLDDGALYVPSGLGRLIDVLVEKHPRIVVSVSVAPKRTEQHDHRVRLPMQKLIPLPHLPSAAKAMWKGPECRRVIERVERASDAVVFQLPFSPASALVPSMKPRVYHLCADVPKVVRASPYYRGMKRIAAVGVAEWTHVWDKRIFHTTDCRVVTNGAELYERAGRPAGGPVVSSSLLAREVASVKRARPASAPFRILFVGYLRPEKGLDVLLRAYRDILDVDPRAELQIVGTQDLAEGGAAQDLRDAIRAIEGRGHVETLGHLRFGEPLFRCFADADVLALPSRSEGTPRVLVEARAFGCPVVASRVGGIPSSVDDEVDGLLVPPDDAAALRTALLRVRDDVELRRRLVARGLERARALTVDAFADTLLREVGVLMTQDARRAA